MAGEGSIRDRLRGLYAITPEERDTGTLLGKVLDCIEGGARLVQYRAKSLDASARLAQARELVALCRAHGVPLIVNDSVELALAVDADGIHLGRDDGDPRAVREQLPGRILGISCYDEVARARLAADAHADYVAIGSVFPSATKPNAVRAPLRLLEEAGRISRLPVCAIGGITTDNAAEAIRSGARMVAVLGALFEGADVRARAYSIARLFNQPGSESDDVRAQPRAV